VGAVSTRFVRRGLLVLVLAIGVSVAWTYRRGRGTPLAAPSPVGNPELPRTTKLTFRSFKGDAAGPKLEVNAETQVGREEEELRLGGVHASFTYMQQGQEGKAFIVSDECIYTPTLKKAVFQGHVKLTTADGVELVTERIVYRGDKEAAHSDYPVAFRRKDVSGSASGMSYDAAEGRMQFPADVVVKIDNGSSPGGEIRAGEAVLVEADKTLYFGGGVTVLQGGDRLTSQRLEADFGDDHVIYRARAIENVVLEGAAGSFPGATGAAAEGGPRRLTARRLDLWIRPDRTISEALAGPEAELTMMPGPKDAKEKRRISAKFLKFAFDERQRITELSGDKEGSLVIEPLDGAQAPPRTMSCEGFVAKLDPQTGQVQTVDFKKQVAFVQGPRHGTAQEASYDGPTGMLYLTHDPVLIDDEQGSELHARAVDVTTQTGDLAARGDVRQLIRPRADAKGSLLGGGKEPIQITSGTFVYTAAQHSARYRAGALVRSGLDEVRAPEIRLQDQEGQRRLEAAGGVVSRFHPRDDGAAKAGTPPAPFEGRSREMTYDEGTRQIVYKGEAVLRQGEVTIRSPEATVQLAADGQQLDKLLAGEPVEIEQGVRRAHGRRAVYTPGDKKMVLTGDKVVVTDPDREVHGRSVIFHVGDDRVIVDGQGLARTQSVFRNRPESTRR
jgi:lipopolysaccharide transport protein LptA